MTYEEISNALEASALPIHSEIYQGAGQYWAAIKDGQVIALRPMSGAPYISLADIGRKRLTNRAVYALETARDKAFTEWRTKCRAELAELGEVVSGTASGGQFYREHALNIAALAATFAKFA